jgi:hypothetical protein
MITMQWVEDDTELLRRAVYTARGRRKGPRWVAVMETFMLGSTRAQELCRRFGYDPDEICLKR